MARVAPSQGPDNSNSVLPPWSLTVAQTTSTHELGYEYVKCSHLFRTDTGMAPTKFRSEPAAVSDFSLQTHRSAEVRVHGV